MLNTHNKVLGFGKYRGERWTRVPVGYLRWIANEADGRRKHMAESELIRRGSTIPTDVELSGHAIDRASQITDEWKEKGVHSWLMIMAGEAAKELIDSEEVYYKGFKFVFMMGNYYPILKTIIRKENENSGMCESETPGQDVRSDQ